MSSNAFKKLSPEVRRELLRHVKSPSSSRGNQKANQQAASSDRTRMWLLGCVGFVGCASYVPYYATQKIGNLTDRDDPLTAAQVRRGAFNNSGSRDAGKHPNWDIKNGRYIYPKGFAEHLKMQNPEETDFGPDIGPMVQDERKRRQQQS